MTQDFVTVDAFTNEPFGGNPAAVCLLPAPRDAAWMQAVACEMNLSETAFLVRRADGFDLRWFTPATEVPLCGHATLAAAHALWEGGHASADTALRFHTKSGVLTAVRDGGWIRMDFPSAPVAPVALADGLAAAIGVEPVAVAANRGFTLAELPSEAAVRALRPDIPAIGRLPLGAYGLIVTARATTAGYDFVSRFFGPQVGIDEDPATGSAHCSLAPYWAAKLDRTEMTGFQASARGAVVGVRLRGDRVDLLGQAVTTLRGTILR